MGPTWELTNDEPSPAILTPADIGVETNGAKSQPDTSQGDQPVRRSQGIQRSPQCLNEAV